MAVEYCGICHSDQSMIDNEWGISRYPFIPGHEVVDTVVRLGTQARGLKLGQRVGIGWYKGSCMLLHGRFAPTLRHSKTDDCRQQRWFRRPFAQPLGLGRTTAGRS